MDFEKVLMGITKYLNREIYSEMTDWQEVLARMAVSRMIGNAESLKKTLIENPFIKTFSIMDEEGNVDVEGVARDLKKQIADKGKLTITVPLFGVFTFVSEDVDKLHRTIMEG